MIQIYQVHAGRDGKPGLSVDDIKIAYSGKQTDTQLEAALKGPMSCMLPPEERATIIQWVHDDGQEERYNAVINPTPETTLPRMS